MSSFEIPQNSSNFPVLVKLRLQIEQNCGFEQRGSSIKKTTADSQAGPLEKDKLENVEQRFKKSPKYRRFIKKKIKKYKNLYKI